jgi:hypothetical protein
MLDKVLETYKCLISGIEKMPGMSLEDAFSSSALASLKKEYAWLQSMQKEKEIRIPSPEEKEILRKEAILNEHSIVASHILWTELGSYESKQRSDLYHAFSEIREYLTTFETMEGKPPSFFKELTHLGYSNGVLFDSNKPVPETQIVSNEAFFQAIRKDIEKAKEPKEKTRSEIIKEQAERLGFPYTDIGLVEYSGEDLNEGKRP